MVGGMSAARRSEGGSPPERTVWARRRDRGRRRRGGPGCGAGPVASVQGAAAPARRVHGLLHQGGPGRAVQAELPVQAHMADLLETESNIVLSGRFAC